MPGLEAIMLCADNSEWMRNGDYSPSRMEAQSEAIQYLASTKINSNPENSVGLLSMAGNRIEVHVSPCRSVGSIMNAMAHKIKVAGVSNLVGALKTAQLALKNRPNKNARQRIIVFVGSPIGSSVEELEKLGKLFKKNNVSIDAVNFGAENASNDNAEKLEALISATNANDSSHLVNIPPGPHNLSDLVLSSSIVVDPSSAAAGGGGVGGVGIPGMEGDVDPELAMAIRMSMEEERARQAASSATAATPATGGVTDQGAVPTNPSLPVVTDNMDEDEEAQLARAIALSMAAEHGAADASSAPEPHPDVMVTESLPATSASSSATAASSTAGATSTSSAASSADIDISAAMEDPDFINSLLASVPGAEGQQGIDNLLDQLSGAPKDDKDKDKDKDKTK